MTDTIEAVPVDQYRAVLRSAGESVQMLNAVAMFSGPGVLATVRWLDELIDQIDQRLGELEKRLDAAGIPAVVVGDDETMEYFRLPSTQDIGAEVTYTVTR